MIYLIAFVSNIHVKIKPLLASKHCSLKVGSAPAGTKALLAPAGPCCHQSLRTHARMQPCAGIKALLSKSWQASIPKKK
jgi:hypothetical protein